MRRLLIIIAVVLGLMSVTTVSQADNSTAALAPTVCEPLTGSDFVLSDSVTVKIATVPAAPLAKFSFVGQALETAADGTVVIKVSCVNKKHDLKLETPAFGDEEIFNFVRWAGKINLDQQNQPDLSDLVIRQDLNLQVGFNVAYVLNYQFADQSDQLFDSSRVDSITVNSSLGKDSQESKGGSVRLAGISIRQSGSRLVAVNVIQRIESVVIDGSNAVFSGKQTFAPADVWHKGEPLKIEVRVYTIHIAAHSRLLNTPYGTMAILTYPDGQTARFPMESGTATVPGLVSGEYTIRIESPGGLEISRPIKVSSNQYVDLGVFTATDLWLLGLLMFAGLAFIVTLRWRASRANRTKAVSKTTILQLEEV